MIRHTASWSVRLTLALAVMAMAASAVAAERVRTRAWAHNQFGRIVFDWRVPVRHTAEIKGSTLTIRFDRELSTSFDHVLRNLYEYVDGISLGSDRKSVVVKLNAPHRMRSFVNQGAVVVDLAKRAPRGTWGERSQASAARARTTPAPKAANAVPAPVPKLRKASKTPKLRETSKTAKVRKASKTAKRVSKSAAPRRLNVRTGNHEGFSRIVFDWRASVEYRVSKKGANVDIGFDRSAAVDVAGLRKALSGVAEVVETETTGRRLRIGLRLPKGARVRHFRDGTRVVIDILAPPGAKPRTRRAKGAPATLTPPPPRAEPSGASGRPVSLLPKSAQKVSKQKQSRVKRRRRPKQPKFGPAAALVTVDVVRSADDRMTIRFNWRRNVAAVVYRRHKDIWVYFDQAARIDLGGIRVSGGGIVDEVVQYPVADASLVRLAIPNGFEPTVGRRGKSWVMEIARQRFPIVRHPIEVRVESDPGRGSQVALSMPGVSRPVRLRDPEIGDVIGLIPITQPGYGIQKPRRFVEFALFSSAAGVAYEPLSEGLRVSAVNGGIVVTSARGLRVSRPEDLRRRAAGFVHSKGVLSDILAWQPAPGIPAGEVERTLMRKVLTSPAGRRNAARIELAKFHLARGRAADALGVVEVVLRQKPTKGQLRTLRWIKAATSYLLGHYAVAEKEFGHPLLKEKPGAAPWIAGVAAARGDWHAAHEAFESAETVLPLLPKWLQRKFTLLAVEAALVSDQSEIAEDLLALLKTLDPTPEQLAEMEYLRGHLVRKSGMIDKPLRIWGELMEGDHRRVRAKATFAHILARLESKKIDPAEAIELLEDLSFAWRGGVFEFDLLRRLGELYIAQNQYRLGLMKLRQAVSYFEKVGGAHDVTESMNAHFKRLYLGGAADKLPPVTALALFEEFRELTPEGTEGDEMIRKLADRLAQVDLLDESANLLKHQVKFRLSGVEKARIATRLAVIRLLDRKPADALAVLKASDAPGLPASLMVQRRYLAARTLSELGRQDEAIGALGDDFSREAEKLRVGIFWRQANWRDAADTLQRLMGWRSIAKGNADDAVLVQQWAIALALLDDHVGLKTLRDRFGEAMRQSAQAQHFRVIAGRSLREGIDYRTLIKEAGDIDTLQSFMTKYRNRANTADLGTLN